MRMVVMLLLGVFIGGLGAVTAISAMRQKTPVSKAVMAVSGHHLRALDAMVESGRCEADAVDSRLRTLRAVAHDIDAVFLPGSGDDSQFRIYSGDLRAALEGAIGATPADCPALAAQLKTIGAACKACHEDFR